MGMGGNELPKDTPQLMKYVDILVTDQNQSLTLNLNTMEKTISFIHLIVKTVQLQTILHMITFKSINILILKKSQYSTIIQDILWISTII